MSTQRRRRVLEVDHLALQAEDALRDGGVAREELVLDLVDVVLDARRRRAGTGRRCRRRPPTRRRTGPCASSLGSRLEAVAHRREVGVLGVADRDDVVGADEDVHLAELDRLGLVQVAGGLQHQERHVAVALELRALMALERVLDGERVQVEHLRDLAHLVGVGPVQPHPGHAAVGARLGEHLGGGAARDPAAVPVHGGVDEGHEATLGQRTPG